MARKIKHIIYLINILLFLCLLIPGISFSCSRDNDGVGGDWNPDIAGTETKIHAADAAINDNFGYSVSISGDTLVVGVPDANDVDNVNPDDRFDPIGSAYVFTKSDSSWIQQAILVAFDKEKHDRFGESVAIDGDTIVVGAIWDNDNGVHSGSAYIFTRNGSEWSLQAKVTEPDGATGHYFGCSVDIDGDNVAIGTDWNMAHIFTRSGEVWTHQETLMPQDEYIGSCFGTSVAIDGDTVIVGAGGDDDNGRNSGSAYIFRRNGSEWTQRAKLTASDIDLEDHFGVSVAISGDTVVVGAKGVDDDQPSSYVPELGPPEIDQGTNVSGSAYVFIRSDNEWVQQAKLTGSSDIEEDLFGKSVAIDGNTIVIGAYAEADNGPKSGSAYVYHRSDNTWAMVARLTASDGEEGDEFGTSVSIDGGIMVVGAQYDGDGIGELSSAYVYENV